MSRPEVRRIWNPPNPYLSEHRELLGRAGPSRLEVWEDRSRTVLSRNDSPDLGFRWSVNPYRGCFHACAYCYARTTHEYLGLGAGTDFDRKIYVKPRAPELLAAEFRRSRWRRELVAFSGATDCYQPLEASWKLTRRCLEVCRDHHNPVAVITKSALVTRDTDVLSDLAANGLARVSLSIPFADDEIGRALEPGAPSRRRRFRAMRELSAAGVPVGISVSPIIPGLNDSDLPGLLAEAKRCGATSAFHTLLRLPGSVREVFFHRLREHLPLRAGRVETLLREARGGRVSESRFGRRQVGEGAYWGMIARVWQVWTRRLGLDTGPAPLEVAPAPDLESGTQLALPW